MKGRLLRVLLPLTLFGSAISLARPEPATAAGVATATVTNCSGTTPGSVNVTVTGLDPTDTVGLTYRSISGDVFDQFQPVSVPASTPMPIGRPLTDHWTLPVSSTGDVTGLVNVYINYGLATKYTLPALPFTMTGCGSLRTVRVTANSIGIAPIGQKFQIRLGQFFGAPVNQYFYMDMKFPASGGTVTLPVTPNLALSLRELNAGLAGSTAVVNELTNNPSLLNPTPGIDLLAQATNEQVLFTNIFTTRPVTVDKVWQDANGVKQVNSQLAFLAGFSMDIQAWDATGPYGPIGTCSYTNANVLSCPTLDVPPTGSVRLVNEVGGTGYSPLATGSYAISQCGPIVNVGSTEFPDFQFPPCSVVVTNRQDPLAATTTTTTSTTPTTPTTLPPVIVVIPGTTPPTTVAPTTPPTPPPTLPLATTSTTTTLVSAASTTTSTSLLPIAAPAVALVVEPTFTG